MKLKSKYESYNNLQGVSYILSANILETWSNLELYINAIISTYYCGDNLKKIHSLMTHIEAISLPKRLSILKIIVSKEFNETYIKDYVFEYLKNIQTNVGTRKSKKYIHTWINALYEFNDLRNTFAHCIIRIPDKKEIEHVNKGLFFKLLKLKVENTPEEGVAQVDMVISMDKHKKLLEDMNKLKRIIRTTLAEMEA